MTAARTIRPAAWAVAMLVLACVMAPVAAQETSGIATDEALVVEDGEGGRYWSRDASVASSSVPRYPRAALVAGMTGCVNIGFIIEPDGTTSGHRVLIGKTSFTGTRRRSTVIGQFAQATVDMLKTFRYQPGPENPRRLRGFASTFADFSLEGSGGRGSECRIENLTAFMRAAAEEPLPH